MCFFYFPVSSLSIIIYSNNENLVQTICHNIYKQVLSILALYVMEQITMKAIERLSLTYFQRLTLWQDNLLWRMLADTKETKGRNIPKTWWKPSEPERNSTISLKMQEILSTHVTKSDAIIRDTSYMSIAKNNQSTMTKQTNKWLIIITALGKHISQMNLMRAANDWS